MEKSSNEKKTYEAPQLTAVSFKVEQGYAASTRMFWNGDEDLSQDNMENYETQENWHSGGQFWS